MDNKFYAEPEEVLIDIELFRKWSSDDFAVDQIDVPLMRTS